MTTSTAAKATTPPPAKTAPAKAHGKVPPAPPLSVNVLEVWQTGFDTMFLLAGAGELTAADAPVSSLGALVKRGIAAVSPERKFTLTDTGRALALLLWPALAATPADSEPAVKAAPARKPAARKPAAKPADAPAAAAE
jgi:hypothetical protein